MSSGEHIWTLSRTSTNMMIEQANEELEILEFQHPNRFQYLKMELKTFISDFESQSLFLKNNPISNCPSALTQESSSGIKKRKKSGFVNVVEDGGDIIGDGCIKRRCKTDVNVIFFFFYNPGVEAYIRLILNPQNPCPRILKDVNRRMCLRQASGSHHTVVHFVHKGVFTTNDP
ncbi:hypothetical protein ACJIZ3_023367 [Penstemon smallii]|uniref:Uncharacterized protein n=1 Tax=Penstemon smallii TaxID=265156 RepID=A0ABD3TNW5_9LAMI